MQLHDNDCIGLDLLFSRPCKQPSFKGNKHWLQSLNHTEHISLQMHMHFD